MGRWLATRVLLMGTPSSTTRRRLLRALYDPHPTTAIIEQASSPYQRNRLLIVAQCVDGFQGSGQPADRRLRRALAAPSRQRRPLSSTAPAPAAADCRAGPAGAARGTAAWGRRATSQR